MVLGVLFLLLAGEVQGGLAASVGLRWERQESLAWARLRGVAVAPGGEVWATGAGGTVRAMRPQSSRFETIKLPDAQGRDFRDVELPGEGQVLVLAIGEGEKSQILKSSDGGRTWLTRYVMREPKGFLDALAFWDAKHGLALGDPVDGRFTILTTDDGGETWEPLPADLRPLALAGEGAFAASGTCLAVSGTDHAWFCTGGTGRSARVFRSADRGRTWMAADTPIPAANASSGLFSLAFRDNLHGLAVGGDYQEPMKAGPVLAITTDGGETWKLPDGKTPIGLRSAVTPVPGTFGKAWITVGPTGSDLSLDDGQTWQPIPGEGFHAVASDGEARTWAVGEDGRVGRLHFGR